MSRWVSVVVLAGLVSGCATGPGHGSAGADLGWAEVLPAVMPAIDRCMAAGGADAVAVSKAWIIGEQLAVVRVLEKGGAREDCVAAAAGDRVLMTEPVPAQSRQGDEGQPLFTPAGRSPPQGSCYTTRAAPNANGWFSYDHCAVADAAQERSGAEHRPPAGTSG